MLNSEVLASAATVGAVGAIPGGSGGRILWIDDEVVSDDPLVRLLQLAGYDVDCAASAERGLELALASVYTIVLLDLRLPDRPGLAVLDILQRHRPNLPIIVVTGFADLLDVDLVKQYGAIDLVAKPVSDEEVIQLVVDAARGSRPHDTSRQRDQLARALSECLRFIGDEGRSKPACDVAVQCSSHRHRLLHLLLTAVAEPDLPVRAFRARADMLRVAWMEGEGPAQNVSRIISAIQAGLSPLPATSKAVTDALSAVQSGQSHGSSAGNATLGHQVRLETGFSLRRWRVTNRVRVATCKLAHSDSQIAQIAYGVNYAVPPN